MIELSPEIATVIMLGGLLLTVLLGYPLALPIGALALVVGYMLFGESVLYMLYPRLFAIIHSPMLAPAPLFIFMGCIMEYSGITERLYATLYLWLGGLRGSLAIVTVIIGTIMAACVGIIGASVSMLSLVALPPMVKRGYSKSLAAGSVCAGGVLGILIPPSVMLIIYGPMAGLSVGKLFFGAIIPGLLLSSLYCIYIILRCLVQPSAAPVIPSEEKIPLRDKMMRLVTSMLPLTLLILSVLGSIFFGLASPTEAAGVGAFAAILLTIVYRKFTFKVLEETTLRTLRISAMILLIAGMSVAYVGVFLAAGCGKVVETAILNCPGGPWGAFILIMFVIFILGMFIDWIGIVFILIPILTPIIPVLGFDPLWFGLMVCVNFQMSFMTPPFAPAIFYVRATADTELGLTTGDIIRGVWPFIIIIVIVLLLCGFFPQLLIWLPGLMIE